MSSVIEYLKDIKLDTYEVAERYIRDTPVETINSLVLYLRRLIDEDYSVSEYTPFTFVPNSDISGTGGCAALSCKKKRALNFSVFTALYADKVYIKLKFITSEHYDTDNIDEVSSDSGKTHVYKNKIYQDLIVIYAYFALIEKSIVVITPTRAMLSASCFPNEFQNTETALDFTRLIKDYTKKAKVVLRNFNNKNAKIRYENIDEFFPEHPLSWHVDNPDDLKILSKFKIGSQIKDKAYTDRIISSFVSREIIDAYYTAFYCHEQSARLITNKASDVMFFSMEGNNDYLKQLEDSHKSLPEYLLPIIKNLDLQTLIHLREEEGESFNKYRIALNNAIIEHKKNEGSVDSMAIYDDIIYPEFNNLNDNLKKLQKSSRSRIFSSMAVVGSVIVANVFGGILHPAILPATLPIGTATAANEINSLRKLQDERKASLQDNDFYFLWKLKQSTK